MAGTDGPPLGEASPPVSAHQCVEFVMDGGVVPPLDLAALNPGYSSASIRATLETAATALKCAGRLHLR